jgi:fermentation-respiration switch protein FrsA (DUF1100 family)
MIVLTGFAIAVAGHLMEVWLLSKKTIRLSTALDFGAAAIIVYLSGWVFTGARVTWVGAVVAALLIGIVELLEHYYLTRAGKVER